MSDEANTRLADEAAWFHAQEQCRESFREPVEELRGWYHRFGIILTEGRMRDQFESILVELERMVVRD